MLDLLRERPRPDTGARAGRSRWAAIGAAVAVTLGAGGAITSLASTSPAPSVFVPMTPCRLLDTRAGITNVGPRATPLGQGEIYVTPGRGQVGACTIPTTATALSMNVAIIDPSKPSYLTVYPGDAARPTAANLNWVAGQDPTPNAVTSGLGADGSLAFFNLAGTVELSVDVVGYYLPADAQASDFSSDLAALGNTVSSIQTRVSTLESPVEIVSTPISVPNNVTAQLSTQIASLTTTTTGRWSISSVWNLSVACSSGTGYVAFLLVDDVIVASTMVAITGTTAGRTAFIGTTPNSIVAGPHTVKVGAWCSAGTVTAIGGIPNTGVTNVTVLR
ncbi:MAG: hypothetical protein U0Q03_09865 [Acidimicrobiales bacterium]